MMDRSVVILRNAGHGVNDIFWYVLPSLLPVILEQFNMKYGAAGGLLTAFIGVIAVFSFILGKISDFLPRHIIIGSGFFAASVFLIGASQMDSFGMFITFILVAGIGVSSFHPIVYAHVDETTKDRQGEVYGMLEFWGAVAIFLMFLLHGFLLKQLSWRTIFFLTSVPGLMMGALYFGYSGRFQSAAARPDHIDAERSDTHDTPLVLFVLFLFVITFRFFGILPVVSFTPTYLVREVGLQKDIASYATGLYFLGGLIFTPILGKQCDVRDPFLVLLLSTGIAFPLIILMSMNHPVWILPIYLFLLGGSYYGAGPAMTIINARMGSRLGRGEAFGYFTALIAIAFSFSPLVFGISADRIGLKESMRLFSIPIFISSSGLFVLSLLSNRLKSVRQDKLRIAGLRVQEDLISGDEPDRSG
jgi:MFS family permease